MKRILRLRGCLFYGVITIVLMFAFAASVFMCNNRPVNISVPTQKVPISNGWDDIAKASSMIKSIGHKGPESVYPARKWSVADLRSFEKANAPAFDILRQGLSKPYLHPPIRSIRSSYKSFAQYGSIRELGRCLVGESEYYSAVGDYEKAADSTLDCMELGVILPRGGSLLTGLAGRSIESIGFKHFEGIIPKLSPDALAHIAVRMEKIQRKRVPFSDIMLEDGKVDTAIAVEVFRSPAYRYSIKNPVKFYMGIKRSQYNSVEEAVSDVQYTFRSCFANKARELRDFETYYTALAAEQRAPYTGKSSVPVPANNIMLRNSRADDIKFRRALFTYNEAVFTLLQTQVALRRYYAEHNMYPARLSQLAPKYLKAEPVDPFGLGKPLKYKQLKNGKEYLLYSIGANMRDDHGNLGDQLPPYDTGDLVAGQLPTR